MENTIPQEGNCPPDLSTLHDNGITTTATPDKADPSGLPAKLQSPDTTNEDSKPLDPSEIARIVLEAEKRGYIRGRNELISNLTDKPDIWPGNTKDSGQEYLLDCLNSTPASIWD